MRSLNAHLSRTFSVMAVVLLWACGASSTNPTSTQTDLTPPTPSPAAAKVKPASPGASPTGAVSGIPRVEGKDIRVTKRVLPDIAAKAPDKAGDAKACRISFILEPSGSPIEVGIVDCEPAYATAVVASAQEWRFQPAKGPSFPSRVRIVREIRFSLK